MKRGKDERGESVTKGEGVRRGGNGEKMEKDRGGKKGERKLRVKVSFVSQLN